jgi:glycine cleavage system H protein
MNKVLDNLSYAKTHEWVEFLNETTARIGISDFAQHELGDLVFINLPQAGDVVETGEAFGDVESVKAVSDIISPLTGVISDVNEELFDNPEKINEDPYNSWFIEVSEISEKSELLTPEAYQSFCEGGA